MNTANQEKLLIPLQPNAWHGFKTESVWVRGLGDSKYQLLNTPFFAKQLSYQDVVIADSLVEGLVFVARHSGSGHSTYRIIPKADLNSAEFLLAWKPLEELGCSYEELELDFRLLAVDVPPDADIYRVYEFLQEGESSSTWDFEEGHCGHVLTEQKGPSQSDKGPPA